MFIHQQIIEPKIDLKTFRPRIPYQLLFLYGGYEDGYPSSTIKTFDIRARQWFQFRPLDDDYPRVYHKLVVSVKQQQQQKKN